MRLYHGSYISIPEPSLNYGRYNLDFGKGFYVTALKEQSEKWALRRVATTRIISNERDIKPIVSVYEIELNNADLSILSFDGYCEEWLDFIVYNRGRKDPKTGYVNEIYDKYDIVYGNVADDDVARAVDDYMELLNKNRVNQDVKNAFLYQLKFSKPNDQYCLITEKAIKALEFINAYGVEVRK